MIANIKLLSVAILVMACVALTLFNLSRPGSPRPAVTQLQAELEDVRESVGAVAVSSPALVDKSTFVSVSQVVEYRGTVGRSSRNSVEMKASGWNPSRIAKENRLIFCKKGMVAELVDPAAKDVEQFFIQISWGNANALCDL